MTDTEPSEGIISFLHCMQSSIQNKQIELKKLTAGTVHFPSSSLSYLHFFLPFSRETPLFKSLLICSAATQNIFGG